MADIKKSDTKIPAPTQFYQQLSDTAKKQIDTMLLQRVEREVIAARDDGACRGRIDVTRMERLRDQLLSKDFLAKARQEIIGSNSYGNVKIDPRINDGLQSIDIDVRGIYMKQGKGLCMGIGG